MSELTIRMTVNGRQVEKKVAPHLRLLDFLRDEEALTGAKDGCGAGECGACMVAVNGTPLKSCLIPVAKLQGAQVVTVEGMAGTPEFEVVNQAFQQTGASQCGYCIPGFVVTTLGLLQRSPQADREQIAEGLGGNLCRCTGYQKIIDAVELARDVLLGKAGPEMLEEPPITGPYIGADLRRVDGAGKIAGQVRYAADMTLPGMHHVKVLRSPMPHAIIAELDTSQAEAMEGVSAVVTFRDVPGQDGFGLIHQDQPTFASDRARFVGEPIAAAAAATPELAQAALAKIKIRYEPLPAFFDPEQVLEPEAPQLHQAFSGNVVRHVKVRKGDVEKGFAEADLIVEQRYTTQCVEHAYLEPEAGLAYYDLENVLTIVSPSQNISQHRWVIAKIMGMPVHKVRMIMSPMGGGFGGKEDMAYQAILAVIAAKAKRPVRIVYTREESFLASTKRHPTVMNVKMGLTREGRITATRIRLVLDAGAYAGSSGGVVSKSCFLTAGPYKIDHVQVDAIGALTNNTPSGAMRTYGGMQAHFGTESHLDLCAEKLGLDPIALRHLNAMEAEAETHTRQKLSAVTMSNVLDSVAQHSAWLAGPPHRAGGRSDLFGAGTRPHSALGARLKSKEGSNGGNGATRKRGRGVAGGWYGIALTGIMDRAGAWVELYEGGTAKVMAGAAQTGEGVENVLVQIAADALGLRPQDIALAPNDTAIIPEKSHAGGSRQTYVVGAAVAAAGREAKAKVVGVLAEHWQVDPALIQMEKGECTAFDRQLRMSAGEAIKLCKEQGIVPIGSGAYASRGTPADPETGAGEPWQSYVFGAQVAEVEVDTVTGEVQVLGLWAAHDIGRAVNPRGVKAQIEGAVTMAVGQALMEDYRLVEGHSTTPNLTKYILPTSMDVPRVTSVLLENPDPKNPIGVRNIGEPAMIPTVPAITNAIYDAVGVRITELPATPEKVLMALRQASGR